MKSAGKIIHEKRKQKGISQEELAVLAKINLRTIQRIKNDENEPRGTTINLICEALQLDQNELKSQIENNEFGHFAYRLVNGMFLILLNIIIASVIIYLTVYDDANLFSRIGAFFLSIFFSYFIVLQAPISSGLMRLVKFGPGFISVIIFSLFQIKIAISIFSGAIPFSIIGLYILFYGDAIKLKK
jgi:transcriptional regulator with XRE-family HTH domain